MASIFQSRTSGYRDFPIDENKSHHQTQVKLWIVPLGRFLFSLIFIMSGFNHFSSGSIGYADSMGIPLADILVPISGLISIIGGVSVLLGFHARVGATLLLIFLIPVTILMHKFWTYDDPQMSQMQFIHFMKNLSIIGGALFISFYGAGPKSLDHRISIVNKNIK
jgi:putative oxidoreductase